MKNVIWICFLSQGCVTSEETKPRNEIDSGIFCRCSLVCTVTDKVVRELSFFRLALFFFFFTIYNHIFTVFHSDVKNEITLDELQNAAQDGLKEVYKMIELEQHLLSKGLIANQQKRNGRSNVVKKRGSNKSRQETLQALGIIEASKKLKER